MKRGMKRLVFLSVLAAVFAAWTFSSLTVHAVSPSNIKLKYDLNNRLLQVTIIHDTAEDRLNYVKFVEIKKNGSVVSIHTYSSQPDGKAFTYQYKINAIEEDTLQAVVTFNKTGIRTSPVLIVAP